MQIQAIQIKPSGTFEMAEQTSVTTLPANLRNEPFNFVHYPASWRWDAKRGFLPALGEITHKAACNGVAEKILNGRVVGVDVNLAWAGSMHKGGIIINPSDPRLGKWRGFLKKTPCDGGGFRYSFVGTTYLRLANGTVNIGEVGDSYADFLAYLRDNGLVHAVDEGAARMLIEQARNLLEKTIQRAGGSNHPVHLRRADEIEEEIAAMTAGLEALRANMIADAGPDGEVSATGDADVEMPVVQATQPAIRIGATP